VDYWYCKSFWVDVHEFLGMIGFEISNNTLDIGTHPEVLAEVCTSYYSVHAKIGKSSVHMK